VLFRSAQGLSGLGGSPGCLLGSKAGIMDAPNDNLYIKGLPPNYPEASIQEIFNAYGHVTSVKVLTGGGVSLDGQGMTVAFVRMSNTDQAQWMVSNLDGNIPQGLASPISCKFAQNQGKGGGKDGKGKDMGKMKGGWASSGPYGAPAAKGSFMGKGKDKGFDKGFGAWGGKDAGWGGKGGGGGGGGKSDASGPLIPGLESRINDTIQSNLYVKGCPMTVDDVYLYKVFAPFGCVLSVRAIHKETFAIGFVKYASEAEAQNAIQNINGLTLTDGTTLSIALKSDAPPKGSLKGDMKGNGKGGAWGGDAFAGGDWGGGAADWGASAGGGGNGSIDAQWEAAMAGLAAMS